MKKSFILKMFFVLLIVFSTSAVCATSHVPITGRITKLKVDGNAIYFRMENDDTSPTACVLAGQDLYFIINPAATPWDQRVAGQNWYAMLLSAIVTGMEITAVAYQCPPTSGNTLITYMYMENDYVQ